MHRATGIRDGGAGARRRRDADAGGARVRQPLVDHPGGRLQGPRAHRLTSSTVVTAVPSASASAAAAAAAARHCAVDGSRWDSAMQRLASGRQRRSRARSGEALDVHVGLLSLAGLHLGSGQARSREAIPVDQSDAG